MEMKKLTGIPKKPITTHVSISCDEDLKSEHRQVSDCLKEIGEHRSFTDDLRQAVRKVVDHYRREIDSIKNRSA